jgi:DNA-directed RNA polymerase specialized sigma24 family protein
MASMNDPTGSVSTCLELLKQGDEAAAARLFERFFRRLVGLARAKLTPLRRQAAADHEDVALSAFHDFCQAVRTDRYLDLHGRQDLWSVLAAFVANKAKTLLDRETAQKRGGAVRGESGFEPAAGESGVGAGLDGFASREADPTLTAEVAELLDRFQARLDAKQRELAALTLESYSSEEIGTLVGMPASTVRRKLTVIRALLAETFGVGREG